MNEYRIAVIGGDGVGPEVVAAGMGVLDTAASGFSLAWEHLPWGSDYYQANGVMMPADGLDVLERFDAICLGAVGDRTCRITSRSGACCYRSGSGSTCT
jgi:tartrate dehydrogenase/decarboxylase/D-malate dehydrogenase